MGDSQGATSYEVIGKLADGDVAELFLAKAAGASGDGTMERLVVIKRIPRKATQNTELVKAFLDEAHISARLQHPNIAQVFEVGKLGGSYFFAMEYVNGETLRALVEHAKSKKIQVPIRSIVTIAAGAVAALHHAHDRTGLDGAPLGIVHADVSPTNLLVSREGIVKLVDFGIAKSRDRSNVAAHPDKVSYWSPEQCRSEVLDRRSDLFSLGVVLWELVTLEDLYHRGGDAKTRAAIENEDAPLASARRYDVPPELDVIIQRMIAKQVADRFKDADEVLAALEGLASKLGFQLSTAELARMMRLWFGNVPDPVVGVSDKLLVVRSEPIPKDLATAPAADPVDALLDTVRNATEVIRAAAAVLGAAQKPGGGSVPTVSDTVESTREDFAQVRDRILAQARKKKETRPPPTVAPTAAEAAAASAGGRPKRETLNSSNNAYSFITNVSGKTNEPMRKMGITTPPLGTALATAAADGEVAATAGVESGGAPTDATTASSTSPATSSRGEIGIGTRTATYEAVADVSINDAVALTSAAMAKAGETAAATHGASVAADDAANTDATADAAKTDAAKADAPADAAKAETAKTDTAAETKTDALADATKDAAAKTDAKSDDANSEAKADTKADAKDAKADPKDAKADAKDAKDAKTDAKADAKTDAKTDAKADAKADAKDKSDAKTDAKDAKDAKSDADAKPKAKDAGREAPPASRAVRADAPRSAAARATSDNDDDLHPPGPSRPGWILPAVLAAGALAVILILFKIKGGNDKPTNTQQQPQQVAVADARVFEPVPTPDATQVAVAPTPDAAEVVAVPVDAAAVAVAPPIDAAVQVAVVTPDAAVEKPKDPVDKPKDPVDKPKDPVDKPKDPVDSAKTIEDMVAAGDFIKANKACKSNTIFNSGRLTACTLAACNAKDTNLAKRWIRAIEKSARAGLITTCTTLGVTVEDPAAPPAPAPAPPAPPAP